MFKEREAIYLQDKILLAQFKAFCAIPVILLLNNF